MEVVGRVYGVISLCFFCMLSVSTYVYDMFVMLCVLLKGTWNNQSGLPIIKE